MNNTNQPEQVDLDEAECDVTPHEQRIADAIDLVFKQFRRMDSRQKILKHPEQLWHPDPLEGMAPEVQALARETHPVNKVADTTESSDFRHHSLKIGGP